MRPGDLAKIIALVPGAFALGLLLGWLLVLAVFPS